MTETSTSAKPILTVDCQAVRRFVNERRQAGKTVGVVMTMGALHAGHLSLVAASHAECDVTVVTIFVNPTQFGPNEDLENYPRQLDADVEALSGVAVDMVFAPTVEQMYDSGRSTMIKPPAVADPWDGRCRPGHFSGVATIVLKMFHIVPADVAYFGCKDFQQLQVVRAMVRDLKIPIRVVACPTVRDADGLAMSSRNVYLSESLRLQALSLSQGLSRAAELFQQGERKATKLAACIRQQLADAGISNVDYVALVEPETLAEVVMVDAETVALIAAFLGETRLIDNRRLGDGPIPISN